MQTARRLRLAVLGAVFAILLAQVVATALLMERSRDAALTAASDTANRVSRAVEASINRNFVQVDAMLAGLPSILAPYAQNGRFDANGAGRVMRELNNQNFTFRDVLLVGADGMPIATALAVSRRRPLPLPLGPAFTDAAPHAGSVMIGGPVQNPATGEWALFFARPIRMPVIGNVTAVAEVPVPLVGSLLAVGGEAPGMRVTLERDDGTLLAALPHDETRIGRRLAVPAGALTGASQARSRFNDEPVLVSVRPTLYPSLSVVTTVERGAALAGWEFDRERALLVSGAFAALVLALAAALLLGLRQREKVEAERARWRSTLENALESMSDGFVMFGPDDRLIACNQRYKEFYAISAPFIKAGAAFRDIMREGAKRGQYPQAVGDLEAFIDEMDAWRHANNPPIERLLPDGRWVLITERSTPDGGTVGIRTDITPLKRAMDELAAARDGARAAGEAKSQFLARMSHELRTPLNGVLGFAQVLLRDPNLTDEQREQVETLHDAGRHLLELVNSLLDLSKIEAGKLDLHLRDVAVRPLLDACAGLLAPEVDRKGLILALDIAPATPPAVEADATRLRQMLLNLLSNAVKFTPPGGRVDFRALPLSGGRPGLRIEVKDTGPGVPPEKRHLLFEDFSQLFPVAGQDGAGTGLGLAISARLAAAMGGQIGCDSAAGQGALFWVELPLREVPLPAAALAAAPAEMLPAAPGRSLRVLVADDVAANRMVARAMLVAAGHRVDSAADGAEALAAVERDSYDVVLMDVQMPVMDGLEATRRIRALDGARQRVPVLAVTASALPEQVAACRAAGMDGHLAKPIDRESLLAAVQRLAAGHSLDESGHATSREMQQPLLDGAALRNLAADLGPTADVVISEFVGEVRLGYETLSTPAIAQDLPRLRHAAHRLLGAARTLGARRLGAVTEFMQAELHAGRDPSASLRQVLEVAAATLPLVEAPTSRLATNDTVPPPRLAQGVGD
ncbi:response regulator [Falsiroseomonas stagni]|uniref:histidine kinase n=1 Tax=Falsiroseomonas stagni DSM 19981 TaxID=1123062 RepID=A0A1I4ECE4_9PROT|nr:response regulator [Falsiroseomonas stagni]SFL03464.1 Hpt domain-containing protein [Falsiroseomonas stagni DSM 19981]